MRGPGQHGLEPARDLVLALRARLEPGQTVLDAVLDALVIARLEVQAVILRRRTPVAPEQRIVALEEDRRRDGRARIHRHFDHQGIGERARDLGEKLLRQIRLMAMTQEGVAMKSIDAIEYAAIQIASRS